MEYHVSDVLHANICALLLFIDGKGWERAQYKCGVVASSELSLISFGFFSQTTLASKKSYTS
jgi:hypothetical protein